MQGKFITVEGIEGVGKSTNVQFIKTILEQQGIVVKTTREPGGTVLAENIRELLLSHHDEPLSNMSELLLMFAARAQHLAEVIQPHLAKGYWVVCDRFTDATYAYQGGGRKIDSSLIADLERIVQGNFRPDLTLLLDIEPKIGLQRATQNQQADRFEVEKVSFFTEVRNAYLALASRYPDRIKLIDASLDLTAVQKQLQTHLEDFIG